MDSSRPHAVPNSLLSALVFVVFALLTFTSPARAQDDDPADEARCHCVHRTACYHFLNAPVSAPDDPCSCEKCETKGRHTPGREIPKGFNRACMASNRMDCFLQRHAASWKLACSACLDNEECCSFEGSASCPDCAQPGRPRPIAKDPFRKEIRAAIDERLAVERKYFKKADPTSGESSPGSSLNCVWRRGRAWSSAKE